MRQGTHVNSPLNKHKTGVVGIRLLLEPVMMSGTTSTCYMEDPVCPLHYHSASQALTLQALSWHHPSWGMQLSREEENLDLAFSL